MLNPNATRISTAGAALALAICLFPLGGAGAQAKLDAEYRITVARIPVGNATVTAELGSDYTISASGHASGAARVIATGEGTFKAQGAIKDRRALPASFRA